MKITTTQVTKHLLTELEGLDPVAVICENLGPGRGKITITCFDDCWSYFWSHMGEEHTLETFFIAASDGYLAEKLCRGREYELDWDALPARIRSEIVRMRREGEIKKHEAREMYDDAGNISSELDAPLYVDLLVMALGDHWHDEIPSMYTREYNYLCRIIQVVKEALRTLLVANAA